MSLFTLGCLFTLGVLAHNGEEAVSLSAWAAKSEFRRIHVSVCTFRFAAVAQSLLLVVLAVAAQASEPRSAATYLFAG